MCIMRLLQLLYAMSGIVVSIQGASIPSPSRVIGDPHRPHDRFRILGNNLNLTTIKTERVEAR